MPNLIFPSVRTANLNICTLHLVLVDFLVNNFLILLSGAVLSSQNFTLICLFIFYRLTCLLGMPRWAPFFTNLFFPIKFSEKFIAHFHDYRLNIVELPAVMSNPWFA